MAIKNLHIINLRNIRQIEINPSPMLNMIWGDNGSGKTSILESIYILCRGRSFRGLRAGPIIRNGEEYLQVFAVIQSAEIKSSIGIKKHPVKQKSKLIKQ
ncbi:AAA family ATPase [Candidatus Vondammii sp. HM_W22]|uniref:AAA family ATPase n=1 Tax=Candidatus Vondammii sp. HM_W22 TaxID=2687299 RepID=UPI00403D8834